MATKNDLIEAQTFSRRRLLTAFVSGAPGGKELEPTAPLRAVIAAIALTVGVILVGVFWGLIRPGLPNGWDNGKLIIVKDTGSRFITQEGVLYPVINTASARLLLPSSDFQVIDTDQQNLEGVRLGPTLGIVGAPDEIPTPSGLTNTGWGACVTDDAALDVRIGGTTPQEAAGRAVVVDAGGARYVVSDGLRFAVSKNDSDAVLRAAGIGTLNPVKVPVDWLNLFTPGADLAPLRVSNAGAAVKGSSLRVGEVLHVTGEPEDKRSLVQSDGTLAELTPLAWQLYQLGGQNSEVREVSQAETGGLPSAAKRAGGADWPTESFTAIDTDDRPCAALIGDNTQTRTVLATQPRSETATAQVRVTAGAGALVRSGGRGDQNTALVTLVDATGTSYALPGATEETIARLGFTPSDIGSAADVWIDLLRTGPALTEQAAGMSPDGSTPIPTPSATAGG